MKNLLIVFCLCLFVHNFALCQERENQESAFEQPIPPPNLDASILDRLRNEEQAIQSLARQNRELLEQIRELEEKAELPFVTGAQRLQIENPVPGRVIYDTDEKQPLVYGEAGCEWTARPST